MLQKSCEIGPDETLGDVYFKKLFPMGVDAMIEGLDLVKAGVIIKHDQRIENGSYESWFKGEHITIDWNKPIDDVYNLIRAANPAPAARTKIDGVDVQIYNCERLEGKGEPGRLVEVTESGIVMQADGGRILIERLRPLGGEKQSAKAWISERV